MRYNTDNSHEAASLIFSGKKPSIRERGCGVGGGGGEYGLTFPSTSLL